MNKLFKQLEERCGTVTSTHKLLGICESGYFQMRKGTTRLPRYIINSMRAHLALSDDKFLKFKHTKRN